MRKYILLIFTFLICSNLWAQREQFEAAFIYQFTKYIEWPADDKTGDFIIGVVGNSPILQNLEQLAATKKVVNQTIVIKKFNNVSQITKCQILYVPSSQKGNLGEVISKVSSFSTLVIGQSSDSAKQGAGIGFSEKNGKLSFEINKSSVSNKKLNINNQLVSLASAVY